MKHFTEEYSRPVEAHLEMHFQLSEGIVVPSETDLVVSSTVQLSKTHAVCPLLRTRPHISNVDGRAESLGCRPVEQRPGQRGEEFQKFVKTQIMGC